jgi:FkbM family methyltransferase
VFLKPYLDEVKAARRFAANKAEMVRIAYWTLLYHIGNRVPSLSSKAVRDVECVVRGRRFRLSLRQGSGDIFTLHEVIGRTSYAFPAERFGAVNTIVDLGANIGLTSLFFAAMFPAARIICVEPDPENFELLRQNCYLNGFQWTCLKCAIGPATTAATLLIDRYANRHRVTTQGMPSGAAIRVAMLDMDDLIEKCDVDTIDVLKVDIEGGEEELFATSSSWISCVRFIIAEFHPSLVDYKGTVESIVRHGFRYYRAGSLFRNSMDMFARHDVAWS